MIKKATFCLLGIILSIAALANDPIRYGIIPKPKSLKAMDGEFRINSRTVIIIPEGDKLVEEIAMEMVDRIKRCSGMELKVNRSPSPVVAPNTIVLDKKAGMEKEAYNLRVTPENITVMATTPNGIYYGIQSVYQLLPPQIYGEAVTKGLKWVVPCCEIEDAPRFPYRGLMLDVGRYFMPKELVMKFIDIMSMHKQNFFHWHLTEDQGWRIEIKKYPRLTEIGSVRRESPVGDTKKGDNTPHGGFYTQEEVKEVVEYARERFVTVVPEIELPGHATAAIAAYPELSCFPERSYEVATTWGVKKDIFCPTATTFRFLEDIFTELFDLFPSPYYHIGGDECPRDHWKESAYCQDLMKVLGLDNEDQLQTFFVQRMAKFLKEKGGKTVIGWDEILDGGAVPGTIVMSYRGHAPAMRAVHQNIRAILTPNRWNYLDYYQEDPDTEELCMILFLPLEKVYNYYPIPDTLAIEKHPYIIGQQGSIWTEYIQSPRRAEYMAFPRAVAMSEVAWCAKEEKDWDSFRVRMLKEFERLDRRGVNYSRAFYNVLFHFDREADFPKKVHLSIDYPEAQIRYTLDGKEPTRRSPIYSDSLTVEKGSLIRTQGFLKNGRRVGKMVEKRF
ncbi:MAG: family 20 glycosylhydrolase [Bacteroidota bacterium]|nr:family 20 glycosylhydrolase [Bacteroidota bacterium]